MTLFFGLILLFGYILVLIGTSLFCARLFSFLTRITFPSSYRLPIGYAIFPVLIAYGGLLKIWHIPFLSTAIGVFAACYGGMISLQSFQKIHWSKFREHWWLFLIPVFVLSLLFYSKFEYLRAGRSDGDESRSILFTSALASNNLKPAYPLDFSLPVAYPYYTFEASAFLYHAARGYQFPSIALFAITLVTIGLFYYVLYLVSLHIFGEKEKTMFFLVSVFLTFSGVSGFKHFLIFPSFVRYQVQPISLYFHSGYHYIWGVCLALWGIALMDKSLRERVWNQWCLAALLLCLSFGYSGISAAWVGIGVAAMLLNYLWSHWKDLRAPLLRLVPVTTAIGVFTVLPQIFSLLPRFDPSFSFSLPHVWFPVDSQLFMLAAGRTALSLWRISIVAPVILLVNIGIFLVIALAFSPFAVTRWITRNNEGWQKLLPFSICTLVAIFLMTFTSATKTDWFSRGFLFPTILCSFIAARLFLPFFARRWLAVPIIVLLLVQAFSFWNENILNHRALPAEHLVTLSEINGRYPLGTIFYEKEYDLGDDIARAGRSSISKPPVAFTSYLLHPDILEKIGIRRGFGPCMHSRYGTNTPTGRFIDTRLNPWIEKSCIE